MVPQPELGRFPGRALLTGAGFSANWGGFLASEIWGRVLGKVRDQPALVDALQAHVGDFEGALDHVRGDAQCLRDLEEAVVEVFRDQQQSIDRTSLDYREAQKLLGRFGSGLLAQGNQFASDTDYIFTLNQDLLIEGRRALKGFVARSAPTAPGLPDVVEPWDPKAVVRVFAKTPADVSLKGKSNYIKLHGSYNWRLDQNGRKCLVVGGEKLRQLEGIDLLRFYFDVFKRVLAQALRLMVIGYSFRDEHINAAISHAIEATGLTLFLIDIRSASQIHEDLRGRAHGPEIFRAIRGFSHAPLSQTLTGNTPELERITKEFFDG